MSQSSSYLGGTTNNSSHISRYSSLSDDYEEEEQLTDVVSTTSIKMKRCDLIAQLERLGYEDVPEDVVQEFIAELQSQNIEVLEDEEEVEGENTTQLSSSVLPDEDDDDEQTAVVDEEDQEEDEVEEEEYEEEETVPVTESEHSYEEEDEMNTYLPEYNPITLHNNINTSGDDYEKIQIKRATNRVNESFNHNNNVSLVELEGGEDYDYDESDGYDTSTYYGKHYSSSSTTAMKEVDLARDNNSNNSFSTTPQIPPFLPQQHVNNNSPTKHNKIIASTTPTKQKIETVSYPFLSSPTTRKSQDIDHNDYHYQYRPNSSRDVSHHDLQTPTSKVKFKPLQEQNYTPPSLPVTTRPKSAPPVKETPIKEPIFNTPPSKSVSPKTNTPSSGPRDSNMVRASTSSSISYTTNSVKPLPFKSNVKKPVTYRKKVNDPVNRWKEMNAMWKSDPFLKNQQSQQKSHRWRVRQEMLEIQGDKYLNPKESRQ